MKLKFVLLFILILLNTITSKTFAQEDNSDTQFVNKQIFLTETNPESPIGIFSLDLPFYLPGSETPQRKSSIGYSMGNTWHPQSKIAYPQNITEQERAVIAEIYPMERQLYFDLAGIETKTKTFASDGVMQHFRLTYLHEFKKKNALICNMNIHWLVGGSPFIFYPASDRFIEWFHTKIGHEDNFGRKQFIFDQAFIDFEDENGNSFHKKRNDAFLSVFDAHYYQTVYNKNWKYTKFNWQAGTHLGIPLNNIHPYITAGISSSLRLDQLMWRRNYFTLAIDGGIIDQELLKFGEGVNVTDWKYRIHAKTYFELSFFSRKNNSAFIGLLNNYQDPLLKGYVFNHNQDGYQEVAINYLKEGDIWKGQIIESRFRHAKLAAASLYFFSIKSYIVLGLRKANHSISMYIGEDLISVNNAPDIQYGIQYTFSPFSN